MSNKVVMRSEENLNREIKITWDPLVVETILLTDLLNYPASITRMITTTEWWPETAQLVDYNAQLTSKEFNSDILTISLQYEKTNNLTALKAGNTCWGRNDIQLKMKDGVCVNILSACWYDLDEEHKSFPNRRTGKNVEIFPQLNINGVLKDEKTKLDPVWRLISARLGQNRLRNELLLVDRKCAISNETNSAVLEAAHVFSHANGGEMKLDNAFLLRADLHRLFDQGLMNIDVVTGGVKFECAPTYAVDGRLSQIDNKVLMRIEKNLKKRNRDITKT
jgi:hypothetical protein